jgi:hypothetical protein
VDAGAGVGVGVGAGGVEAFRVINPVANTDDAGVGVLFPDFNQHCLVSARYV